MPDITLEINEAVPVALGITNQAAITLTYGYGAVIATMAQLEEILNTFDEYDSDESAALGGVASGEWYVTADNHMSLPGGILKQNRL